MNKWGIPEWLEREVRQRDASCIYCRAPMFQSAANGVRRSIPTWEHIINDAKIITRENIALCCASCNSSKGTKRLSDWLDSDYCRKRGITRDTVAEVVKRALIVQPNLPGRGI
jgi:hypothetical protein